MLNCTCIAESGSNSNIMRDQRLWSVQECADIFGECLHGLKGELAKQGGGRHAGVG